MHKLLVIIALAALQAPALDAQCRDSSCPPDAVAARLDESAARALVKQLRRPG